VWILVPLSVLGGFGNGYAGTCLSTLLMARTPDSARGRVSATSNAVLAGAHGVSLLLGGVVAIALSPRAIYAVTGLLGLAAAGIAAVTSASRTSSRAAPADAAATNPTPSRTAP
jgi:MFS family permease